MPWFVYIAHARMGRLYTGITTDPQIRIATHNTGKGSRLAKLQGLLTLVYVSPPFADKSAARKHEVQVKGWTRIKKENLMRGEWV